MSLDDLLYKVHEKTEELYELAEEIEKQACKEGIIEDIESDLVKLDTLIEGLYKFDKSVNKIYDSVEDEEPDWYHIKLQERLDEGE